MELNSLYIKKFDFLALNIIHWGEKSSNQDIIAISFFSSCEMKENDISMQIYLQTEYSRSFINAKVKVCNSTDFKEIYCISSAQHDNLRGVCEILTKFPILYFRF